MSDPPSVDSHVHVWCNDTVRYPLSPLAGLRAQGRGSATAVEFFDEASGGREHVGKALLIQPWIYGYDHTYLFDAAAQMPDSVRVMPLIDPTRHTSETDVRRLAENKATAGVRVRALGSELAESLCRPESNRVWKALSELGLPVGFLIDPPQLLVLAKIATAYPGLLVVIDHLARCSPSLQAQWMSTLVSLAGHSHVHVKLSALGALSGEGFPFADMWQIIGRLYDEYGAHRLLWGSDWPHCKAFGSYDTSAAALRIALRETSSRDIDAIMGQTACRLFHLS